MHKRPVWETARSAEIIYELSSNERFERPEFQSEMRCPPSDSAGAP